MTDTQRARLSREYAQLVANDYSPNNGLGPDEEDRHVYQLATDYIALLDEHERRCDELEAARKENERLRNIMSRAIPEMESHVSNLEHQFEMSNDDGAFYWNWQEAREVLESILAALHSAAGDVSEGEAE